MAVLDFLADELARLERDGLLRTRVTEPARADVVDVCSNDYLGYAGRVVSRETSATAGAGAARQIHGTRSEHVALERELAEWVGAADSLFFPSGYAANVGTVSALAQPGDVVVSDALNHASTIDGCRLSRAHVEVVPHRDLGAVARALALPTTGRRWVFTESYFSMDADSPDLRGLRELCDRAGAALVVDEAHALGVFGPGGAGLCAAAGVVPDVFVGTLGKAVGVQGAFVAGSKDLAAYLWNKARSFVFTTAPSPVLASMALEHVRLARRDDAGRERLAALCSAFEHDLGALRSRLPAGRHGPIFPLVVGTADAARTASAALLERGFLSQAIRPPTVPEGTSRLRLALKATLSSESVAALASALLEICHAS